MSNGNWTINHTFKDRYVVTGITDLILEHVKDSNKKLEEENKAKRD